MKYLVLTFLFCGISAAFGQQIGVGGGLAVPSGQIAQLPSDLQQQGWSGITQKAQNGYYVLGRAKVGMLVASISYNRFLQSRSEYRDNSGRDVELLTSQAIVPVTLGIRKEFGSGFIAPYVSAEASASYFYRAFESTSQSVPVPFQIESDGDMRAGVAVGAGLGLDLKIIHLDLDAHLHFPNLLSHPSGESTISFLQLGTVFSFGL